jgi:2-polyprenyl-6-methoxyphenol hydroxylase-like FAD-dependent oxidoreductase
MNHGTPHLDHAIVMGGSMAGLLAARVLADRCRAVTILERDEDLESATPRRGVPQGQHTHGLLASGCQILDDLFPGFSRELTAIGAERGDLLGNARWFIEGGHLARTPAGLDGVLLTRPLLETAVRRRVRSLPNVVIRGGCAVGGLLFSPKAERVEGVRTQGGEVLRADLVVDATGRGSRTRTWLAEVGYESPAEDRVDVSLHYTTRFFRRSAAHLGGDIGALIPPTPTGKRGGVMLAQEGQRWTVTLISHHGSKVPGDLAGFRAYAASLPASDIHDVICQADPVSDPVSTTFPASVRRRFERLRRFPEQLVVIGDGLCSFNPIYGQGMSVAALEARALGKALDAGVDGLWRRFYQAAATIIDTPWTTAVGNDLRMPELAAKQTRVDRIVAGYIARLHRAAHRDAELAARFMRVANLLATPASLFAPATMWRVVRGSLARRRASTSRAWPAPSRRLGPA